MESILLENLARNQAFAAALRVGNPFDQMSRDALQAVMFQPNEGPRREALDTLETKAVGYFRDNVQTAARKQGVENARGVLRKITGPAPATGADPALRRRILIDGPRRAEDRVRIFQALVNDQANTLDNRLTAYWLEPGAATGEKLARLRALHGELEAKRVIYERALGDYYAGRVAERPRTPNLDYMSKLTQGVKMGALEQARRSGTDAEVETFVKAGEAMFAWVTVNASEACKDCQARQGKTGTVADFDRLGRPGSGKTVCGSRCFCMLLPARTLTQYPALEGGLNQRPRMPPAFAPTA